MAKRISREGKAERRKRRNSIIIGVVLVALMVFGTFGAFAGQNNQNQVVDNSFEYGGHRFKFVQKDTTSYYATEIDDVQLSFFSRPHHVQALNLDDSFLKSYPVSNLIFTSEPLPMKGTIPVFQQYLDFITSDVSGSTGKSVLRGYLKKDIFDDGPVYTCDDASAQNLVVVYKGVPASGVAPGIYRGAQDYCFDLFAKDSDLILLRDYLIYLHWGILSGKK